MPTKSIGRAKATRQPSGKVTLEPARAYRSATQRRAAEAKAERKARAWAAASQARAFIRRRQPS